MDYPKLVKVGGYSPWADLKELAHEMVGTALDSGLGAPDEVVIWIDERETLVFPWPMRRMRQSKAQSGQWLHSFCADLLRGFFDICARRFPRPKHRVDVYAVWRGTDGAKLWRHLMSASAILHSAPGN